MKQYQTKQTCFGRDTTSIAEVDLPFLCPYAITEFLDHGRYGDKLRVYQYFGAMQFEGKSSAFCPA